ncbi:dynein heavy chain, N-terminal region 1-domain-containing protein [Obelidium mucronatum]|nr:dynein heavy chain, N-terminal region 1-domain-containing protein [Obelidium mucronatum]
MADIDHLHQTDTSDPKKKLAAAGAAAANNTNLIEKRRASLDVRHRFLLEKFSAYVDEKPAGLENSLLLGNKLEVLNDFFAENGAKKVLFYWQKDENAIVKANPVAAVVPVAGAVPPPGAAKPTAGAAAASVASSTLVVSNGSKEGLTGTGCFFIRTTNKAITVANISNEVSFGLIQANILPSLTTTVKHVLMPALKAQENWGVLQRQKDESVKGFVEVLERFVNDLDVAMVNLSDSVKLNSVPSNVDLDAFKKPAEYGNAAHFPEVVNALEGLVTEWCKQIEQVLAESEQMRKEADDIGPNAELAHWKARMVKFNSITDQLKSSTCKKVIGILNAVKSRALLKTWKDLDDRVTDAANESKDNVKYLYTLERFYDPLYSCDPLGMIPSIPGLINAIKMIYR